jgi:glycogen(starch) synthase
LAVVTPWYPSAQRPFAGSFVQTLTDAVAEAGLVESVDILNGEDWPGPGGAFRHDLVRTSYERLTAARQGASEARIPLRSTQIDARQRLLQVPVPVRAARDYAEWGRMHEAALRSALPGGRIEADLVHGHVGTYGGWVACRLARPDARIVVTEHASFLARILRQPEARRMYQEVLERADEFLCVSEVLRERLAQSFPALADKLSVVPNVVDAAGLAPRQEPPAALKRWLFLGHLAAGKGVPELMEAFARALVEEPDLRLTLAGWGVPAVVAELREQAARLGVAERVEFLPPQPPSAVPELLRTHDLLVHPSKYETFGMTVVEAMAVGTPVLVTRCGGPEETLAGLEPAAGRLIEVSDDPQVIVDGYRRMRGELEVLDPERVRAEVERRYGRAAVVEGLAGAYGLEVPKGWDCRRVREPSAEPEPKLRQNAAPLGEFAFLSVGGNRGLALRVETTRLVEAGAEVDVFSLDEDIREHADLDPRVTVHTVRGPSGSRLRGRIGGRLSRMLIDPVRVALLGRLVERRAARGAQLVLIDSHAFASAWRIARSRTDLRIRVAPELAPESDGEPAEVPAGVVAQDAASAPVPAPTPARVEPKTPPPAPADAALGPVLFISVGGSVARSVKNHAAYLIARGVPVELITVNPVPWQTVGLDRRVRVHSLREGEGRHPLPRTERVLVYRAPGKALDLLSPLADRPRYGRGLEVAVGAAGRGHRRVADAFHQKVFIRGYRVVRPYLLWRITRSELYGQLAPGRFKRAVVWDTHSVPIGWHLAREFQDLEVSLGLDRSEWQHLPMVDPEVDPTRAVAVGEPVEAEGTAR